MTEPIVRKNACGNCAHLLKLEVEDTSGMCTHEQSSQGLVFVTHHCDLYEEDHPDHPANWPLVDVSGGDCCKDCKHMLFAIATATSICQKEFDHGVKSTDWCEDFEKREAVKVCLTCKWYVAEPAEPAEEGGFVLKGRCAHALCVFPDDTGAVDSCLRYEEKSHEGR